jgi:hypothetical protein
MKTEHLFKHAAVVGVFAIFLYAACLLWRFTMSDPTVMQFHLLALKTAFPMVESRMVKETIDGKDWYHSEPWYRFVDPHEHLKGYKIVDYLRVTHEKSSESK